MHVPLFALTQPLYHPVPSDDPAPFQNIHWLEDKWARQGRGTLADVIGSATPLGETELKKMAEQASATFLSRALAQTRWPNRPQPPSTADNSPTMLL